MTVVPNDPSGAGNAVAGELPTSELRSGELVGSVEGALAAEALPDFESPDFPSPGLEPPTAERPAHLRVAPDPKRGLVYRRRRAQLLVLCVAALSAASMFLLVTFHVFAAQSAFTLDKLQTQLATEQRAVRPPAQPGRHALVAPSRRERRPAARHGARATSDAPAPVRGTAVRLDRRPARSAPQSRTPQLATTPVNQAPPPAARCPARRPAKRVAVRPTKRIAACSVLVVLVFGALAFRVTQLQVLSGNRYRLAVAANRPSTPCRCRRSAERSSIGTVATWRCRSTCRRSTPIPQQVWDPIVVRGRARAGARRQQAVPAAAAEQHALQVPVPRAPGVRRCGREGAEARPAGHRCRAGARHASTRPARWPGR